MNLSHTDDLRKALRGDSVLGPPLFYLLQVSPTGHPLFFTSPFQQRRGQDFFRYERPLPTTDESKTAPLPSEEPREDPGDEEPPAGDL